MADNNPFLEFLASQQGQDDGAQPPLAPLSPQERDLLGSGGGTALSQPPDTSNLPVSSTGAPQPLQGQAQPAQQPQAQQSQGYQGPRPILYDLISGLANPRRTPGGFDANGVQLPDRIQSRGETFLNFLSPFVEALSQGFANAGHGPGSFGRGFGAAATAPLQFQEQQQGFQQQQALQQAQLQQEQAKTQQILRQPDPRSLVSIPTPSGVMQLPYQVAVQSGLLKGALGAEITAQNKMSIAELNAATKQGAVKFIKPVQDPKSGRVVFGAYDAQGNFLRPLDNSIDPSALPKFNKQWQPDGNGGLVMTQESVSGPQLPAQGGTPVNRIPQSAGRTVPSGNAPASVGGTNQRGASSGFGPIWSRPDVTGFVPDSSQFGLTQKEKQTEYNRRQDSYKKNSDELSKTEGTINQFQSILDDINAGKDITGAQSVVGLFNAIGISATPLKGAGFRINSNTITEHAEARGLGESLYQKLLSLKNGDVITPQQLKDYASIASQAREDQYVNLTNQVHNAGLNADFVLPNGNGRQIDPSTARIFLRLTGADNQGRGGDPGRARAAAKAKGWKF